MSSSRLDHLAMVEEEQQHPPVQEGWAEWKEKEVQEEERVQEEEEEEEEERKEGERQEVAG